MILRLCVLAGLEQLEEIHDTIAIVLGKSHMFKAAGHRTFIVEKMPFTERERSSAGIFDNHCVETLSRVTDQIRHRQ
jgi:hypothetical protein